MITAHSILLEAAETNRRKSAEYGNNIHRFGDIAMALLGDVPPPQTADDWNRLHLIIQMIVKLTRYVENWSRGGHADSLLDLAVYSAMLGELDASLSQPDR